MLVQIYSFDLNKRKGCCNEKTRTEDCKGLNVAWVTLFFAGLFEIGWAIGLKYSDGFTKPLASTLTVIAMVISVVLLGWAMKTLPVGTAYSVWVGIGAIGTVILGIFLFNEPADFFRMASVGLIIAGVVGLKLASST